MNSREFIESGILESYVLGCASEAETQEVETMAAVYEDVRKEIDEISVAFEKYALANAIEPDPTIRPFLMATIDYTERMAEGEEPSFPPLLHKDSALEDYHLWLSRKDIFLPDNAADIYAKIIGYTPEVVTAIVWLRDVAPQEVHHNEFEKFLIVEGTCEITIGENVHQLSAGDYLAIPLYQYHTVKVTSEIPCKVILQRVAA